MSEGDEVDIEGILSDLDSILSGTIPAENLEAPSSPAAAAAQPPVAIPAKPFPTAEVKIQSPAASPPAAKPPAEMKREESPPSQEMKIELGPRQGLGSPKPASVPAEQAEPPKPSAASYRPPLEIQAAGSVEGSAPPSKAAATSSPAPAVVAPAPQPSPAAAPAPAAAQVKTTASPPEQKPPSAPAPMPVATPAPVPVSVPAPVPVSAPAPAPGPAAAAPAPVPTDDSIPANVPKDQIRRVACLYGSGQKAHYEEFIKFIDSMALHFTKKSLYLRKALVIELAAADVPQAVFEKIKASGAVGVVGLMSDVSEAKLRSLEEPLSAAGLFYRWIPMEDVGKRSTAVDLLVDLTLLSFG